MDLGVGASFLLILHLFWDIVGWRAGEIPLSCPQGEGWEPPTQITEQWQDYWAMAGLLIYKNWFSSKVNILILSHKLPIFTKSPLSLALDTHIGKCLPNYTDIHPSTEVTHRADMGEVYLLCFLQSYIWVLSCLWGFFFCCLSYGVRKWLGKSVLHSPEGWSHPTTGQAGSPAS